MLETGRILQDRYRVEKHVGQGGMGTVYLATDERFHSTVAIKETLFGDEKFRKAFSREARLLNSLKHAALPKVTDHFVEDNGQYIVMEFIGGDDLFEMMRKSGMAFPAEEVIEWADQLLEALSYLHEQGIIHRDIKPQNLKLTPQNKIILLDFGLAKGNPTDANFQTAPQSIFGYSRNYASLEQIQGTGTDPRSDIYSLAATLYHLITGQVPADALTRVMMVLNDNKDPLEPAGKFNSAISQEISDALETCLSLKAASRPQNVEEARALLKIDNHTPFVLPEPKNKTISGRDELLTQNTMVFEGKDSDPGDRGSELKTEVMGDTSGSVSTHIANKATIRTDDPANRSGRVGRWGVTAAAGAVFLIVGSIAATVLYWPAGGSEVVPVGNSNVSNTVQEFQDKSNSDNSNFMLDQQLAEETTANLATPAESAMPPADKTETSPSASTSKADSAPKIKDKKQGSGTTTKQATDQITIKDGIVRTPDVIIDDKGVIVFRTPLPNGQTRLTREQLKKLTPAQRRRLAQKIEADRRDAERRRLEILKNQPSPPPTPKPPPN